MNILFQRDVATEYRSFRYVLADSANMFGRKFLCVREDVVRFPFEGLNARTIAGYDLNEAYHTRLMPLSSVGLGHASSVKATVNVGNMYMMESSGEDQFDSIRGEVCGFCTDQGGDIRGIGEEPVTVLPMYSKTFRDGDARGFVWPRALMILGHLHMLFNALEEACKSLGTTADALFEELTDLCNFLGDGEL